MNSFETVIYEKEESVGYITLNRPQALNVYNIRMRDELYEILSAVRDDADVRVAVLKGAGERAFCAGADLAEFLTAPSPTIARRVRFGRDVWGLFLSIPKPFIAAVHGYVLGSGIEIALCCDIRLAADDARFGVPEMGLGIIPAAGGSQTLQRIVGPRALEMLLSGRFVRAEEARRLKLVNQVVPRAELLPAVRKLTDRLTSYPAEALSLAKQAITQGLDMTLEQGLALEARLGGRLMT